MVAMETTTVTKIYLWFSVCSCKFYDCAKFHAIKLQEKKLLQVKILKFLVSDYLKQVNSKTFWIMFRPWILFYCQAIHLTTKFSFKTKTSG